MHHIHSPAHPSDQQAVGSAHGKLILLGEHAVVYGVPALVLGVDLRVRAVAHGDTAPGQRLIMGERRVEIGREPAGDLARALAALLAVTGAPPQLELSLGGELPAGVGLGYSAAAGVAIARAVLRLLGRADEPRVRAAAMAWEGVFHGNPSGVDVAAAMAGGALRFTRASGTTVLPLASPLSFCVGLTGQRSSTRAMVQQVAMMHEREPQRVGELWQAIARLVDGAERALGRGDVEAVGERMTENQRLLDSLGVGSEAIDALVGSALEAGALGAKLTGAGGGGAVVALTPTATGARVGAQILQAWKRRGYDGMVLSVTADKLAGRETEHA